jgi:hypothetical protein
MMKTITLALLSVLLVACATRQRAPATGAEPSSTAAPAGVAAASAPVGTTLASAASTSAASTPSAPAADHPADAANSARQAALKHGYKLVHRNGQDLYCRSEILTGTHFRNTVCLTEAQVSASERDRQEVLDQLGKGGAVDCRVVKCN